VTGTLYCAKGNYNFGVSRIVKSLEPFQKKLGTGTWLYARPGQALFDEINRRTCLFSLIAP